MTLAMTGEQRAEWETAGHTSRHVRHWKREQAVLLRAAGTPGALVAQTLGWSEDRVSNWTHAWQAEGLAGVSEGQHPGAARRLDGEAEPRLEALLASDPQAAGDAATGWTVPVRRTELAQDGGTASERTIRRTVQRLGGSWKRPKFVLGRPDPADAAKTGRSSSK